MSTENGDAQSRSSSPTRSPVTKVVRIPRPRAWRACEICRKRKIRCDGQDPCTFCSTNDKDCIFTPVEDHASSSRQRDNDTQARLEKLEDKLDRLLPMVETTHTWLAQMESPQFGRQAAGSRSMTSTSALPLYFQASPLLDVPATNRIVQSSRNAELGGRPHSTRDRLRPRSDRQPAAENPPPDATHECDGRHTSWVDRLAGQYAKDSQGNMRYLGGAPTFVLAEAVESVRQAHKGTIPVNGSGPQSGEPTVDRLYFRPNVLYRPLQGLPSPEKIEYPPMIISDALVQMYFSKIHHTFPVLDKPRFMRQYEQAMDGVKRGQPSRDSHFLCVLFAVYASAATMTKKVFTDRTEFEFSSPREYIGLEFYETALYMYWTGFRMMTVHHVTCMALLSACLAGWNTLAQSWVLAGQAVRGAQDLGLHRSIKKATLPSPVLEHRRRVWWSVYGLDRMLSVSLGRPSGINDDDCDVDLPSDEQCCEGVEPQLEPAGDNPITGFQNLLKIYSIAGEIERRAHSISFLKTYDNSADHPVVRKTINELDRMLEEWSENLPDCVRYAANRPDRPDMFVLSMLAHFTMYACTLNLHRPFMPDLNTSSEAHTRASLQKCVEAAQGCIQVGEEVRTFLPTSHHCQFCVQYLTICGVTLLRCLPYSTEPTQLISDATRSRRLLALLEDTWPGSKQCGALLQDLLDICKKDRTTGKRREEEVGHDQSAQSMLGRDQPRGQKRSIDQVQELDSLQHLQTWFQGSAANAGIPLVAEPNISVSETTSTTTGIDDQGLSWLNLPASPFANPLFVNQAPVDLADEIASLLAQFQNPAPTPTPEQWSWFGGTE